MHSLRRDRLRSSIVRLPSARLERYHSLSGLAIVREVHTVSAECPSFLVDRPTELLAAHAARLHIMMSGSWCRIATSDCHDTVVSRTFLKVAGKKYV
jgi:hypothetical protein